MSGFIDGLAKLFKDKFQFKAEILESVREVRIGETNTTNVTNNVFLIGNDVLSDSATVKKLEQVLASSINARNKEAFFAIPESYKRLPIVKSATTGSQELDFFKGKIPDLDFSILKIALIEQSFRLEGNSAEADRVKNEACNRYGDLARNILNIYSSGYFSSTIKPLYEILEHEGVDLQLFSEMYKIIVQEAIFTVFIATTHTFEEAQSTLNQKIEVNKAYGAYKINIHGINEGNVKKIEKLVDIISDEIEGNPIYIRSDRAITVKINLKRPNHSDKSPADDLVSMIC